jgi:hypothetical protein
VEARAGDQLLWDPVLDLPDEIPILNRQPKRAALQPMELVQFGQVRTECVNKTPKCLALVILSSSVAKRGSKLFISFEARNAPLPYFSSLLFFLDFDGF